MEPVVVTHTTGTLALEGAELVATMAGTSGLFRKTPWEKVDRTPLSSISSIRVADDRGRVDLAFARDRGLPIAYRECQPLEAIEVLVEAVVEASPRVVVNDVDMAEERAKLERDAKARGEEIVGVDRRVTLTRLALGGIVGGLMFKKRAVVRRKDA